MISREDFLKPTPRRYKTVTLPDGRTCRIRSVNEQERQAFEQSIRTRKGELHQDKIREIRGRYIVLALVGDDGEPILSEADLGSIGKLDVAVTNFLSDQISKHCGFGETDIEELAKNYLPPLGDDSQSN